MPSTLILTLVGVYALFFVLIHHIVVGAEQERQR